MQTSPHAEVLANRKQRPTFGRVAPAQHGKHLVTVTLAWPKHATRRNQLVNDGNHQPLVGDFWLINLRAGIVATVGDSAQLARTDLQHVNRTVWQRDEQISGAGEKPNRKLWRKKPVPLLQEQRPIQACLVNQVVVNVHGASDANVES